MPEAGSDEVLAIWNDAERVLSSLLLYPEARAALGRAVHSRRLGGKHVPVARALAESLWSDIDRIGLTEPLVRRAGDLAEQHRLRAYDAVHLASFEHVDEPETLFVSADVELLDAAGAMGFTTVRPLG